MERAYTDSRNDVRDKAIDEKNKIQDVLSSQRDTANLANPMSSLSGQERYMQQMKELGQKNSMFQGAQTAQTRENELKAAQATQATATGGYYNELGGQAKALAGEKTFETERDRMRNSIMTPDVLQQVIAKTQGIPDLFKPKPGLAVPNAPQMNFGAKNDSSAPLDMNPVNTALNQRTSSAVTAPITPVSQQPYTDAYHDFSSSILGQSLGLPGTNNLIQEGLLASSQLGTGIAGVGNFLTKPRKRNLYGY
jgi:hypothetical protein